MSICSSTMESDEIMVLGSHTRSCQENLILTPISTT